MKKLVNNQFKDGLNLDLHPIVTPNTVLTDNLNGTLITYNGNELSLQNDRGNTLKAILKPGYTPIGIKEHNGILYIVSTDGTNSEIGTYPGTFPSSEETVELETPYNLDFDNYTPLHNFVSNGIIWIQEKKTDYSFRGFPGINPFRPLPFVPTQGDDPRTANWIDYMTTHWIDTYPIIDESLYIMDEDNVDSVFNVQAYGIELFGTGYTTSRQVIIDGLLSAYNILLQEGLIDANSTCTDNGDNSYTFLWNPLKIQFLGAKTNSELSEDITIFNLWFTEVVGTASRYEIFVNYYEKNWDYWYNLFSREYTILDKEEAEFLEDVLRTTKAESVIEDYSYVTKEVIKDTDVVDEVHTERAEFNTSYLNFSKEHPVTIEVQDSYDGSVNLILTDNYNPPRIINTGFSVLPNDQYKLVRRTNGSNLYETSTFDALTKLIQTSKKLTYIDLDSVISGGQLKGGNYTFYLYYGDSDSNQTDIICQSGVVSVFKGTDGVPASISGTLADERTDKLIKLHISDIDSNYQYVYLAYTREYSDTSGFSMVEANKLIKGYAISGTELDIVITGFEQETSISIEDLNITYHTVNTVKTIAQQQDMLFLGNISNVSHDLSDLQNLSYQVKVKTARTGLDESIGYVNSKDYSSESTEKSEYYSTKNIYYSVGYWPEEYYRFGIVYVLSDGSKTPVFNLKGCLLESFSDSNMANGHVSDTTKVDDYGFLKNTTKFDNVKGVFKTPYYQAISKSSISTMYFLFDLSDINFPSNIIGYTIVRQKRIPTTILQGLMCGVEQTSGIPILKDSDGDYKTESLITSDYKLKYSPETPEGNIVFNSSDYYMAICIAGDRIQHNFVVDGTTYTWWKPDDSRNYYYVWIHYNGDNSPIEAFEFNSFSNDFIGYRKYDEREYGPFDSNIRLCYTNDMPTAQTTFVNSDIRIYNYNYDHTSIVSYVTPYYAMLNGSPSSAIMTIVINQMISAGKIKNGIKNTNVTSTSNFFNETWDVVYPKPKTTKGLLTLDPLVDNSLKSQLNATTLTLSRVSNTNIARINRLLYRTPQAVGFDLTKRGCKVTFIDENSSKSIDSSLFSTVIGSAYDKFNFIDAGSQRGIHNILIRGQYTPFVGITDIEVGQHEDIEDDIYQLRNIIDDENAFIVRFNDNSEFYACTKMYPISEKSIKAFNGDCYSVTQTIRIVRNFIDPQYPYTQQIIKPDGLVWYSTNNKWPTDKNAYNLTDMNTVSLGHWVTFKCLSNVNLGLRSTNPFDTAQVALMGTEKTFYPLHASTATPDKVGDSYLLNAGYSKQLSRIRHEILPDIPYYKNEYSNRIMFSNKNVHDQFINGYRTFQGLAYHDYDKQYGEIVKLLPWGNSLFCVFEHGCAILPVNEKALIQTTTEQTIHIYGHGVLPDTISVASPDYGSKYPDSVIRTPIGIYGIDVDAKKIWRFSDKQGFETISDMKIETFLNEIKDVSIYIGSTDIRTHYNSFKGDVIFTWYKYDIGEYVTKSICFNERQNLWITKYNWIPIVSENKNGYFYSLQKGEDSIVDSTKCVGIYAHEISSNVTQWYGQQQPFEFEFVISDPIGVHKIIDNLQIIANNVQPEQITYEIIGDAYNFNKERITHLMHEQDEQSTRKEARIFEKQQDLNIPKVDDEPAIEFANGMTEKSNIRVELFKNKSKTKIFDGTSWDGALQENRVNYYEEPISKQYRLSIPQECKNIETWGRRLGNIHYKLDSWYLNVEPLKFDPILNDFKSTLPSTTKIKEARIRDKWCKIKVRYTGEDLAIITAIKTSINI